MYKQNTSQNDISEIDNLNVDEITYLQLYLEKIKRDKLSRQKSNALNTTVQNLEPGSRGAVATRCGKRSTQTTGSENLKNTHDAIPRGSVGISNTNTSHIRPNQSLSMESGQNKTEQGWINAYHNPYEYGSKQNSHGYLTKAPIVGPYQNDLPMFENVEPNKNYQSQFPGIRNVNVESQLKQREMTHFPGQREITETELDRFNLLPFDPQDTRHLVWRDNMPRGGFATRNDRLEY